jgi:hypothetical protein
VCVGVLLHGLQMQDSLWSAVVCTGALLQAELDTREGLSVRGGGGGSRHAILLPLSSPFLGLLHR